MAKKQEEFDPSKPVTPREKTEFDKIWQRVFKEAEKPFKEHPLHPEHSKKKKPPKKDGSGKKTKN